MGLYKRIEEDLKTALRAGDTLKLSVLRMLSSAIKTFAIDKNLKEPENSDILQIVQKQAREHKESISQFEKGSRKDLADKEARELVILESYLPEQLSAEELTRIVKEAITATGAVTKADMGKVMKAVMEKVKGRTDGKTVNQILMGFLK